MCLSRTDFTEISEKLDIAKIGTLKLKNLGMIECNHMQQSLHSPFKLKKHTQKIYCICSSLYKLYF